MNRGLSKTICSADALENTISYKKNLPKIRDKLDDELMGAIAYSCVTKYANSL